MMNDENAPWEYKPEGDKNDSVDETDELDEPAADIVPDQSSKSGAYSWQSVEFIEHPHNANWYGALVLLTVVLTALVYFITRDFIATGTIPIVGIIVAVFAGHKPKTVQYEVSRSGLKIGPKNYPYNLFKSFAVLQEGDLSSANLFPLKRFMPPITAYFVPGDGEKITNILGEYLPYEERKMDGIDRLSRRLRL